MRTIDRLAVERRALDRAIDLLKADLVVCPDEQIAGLRRACSQLTAMRSAAGRSPVLTNHAERVPHGVAE